MIVMAEGDDFDIVDDGMDSDFSFKDKKHEEIDKVLSDFRKSDLDKPVENRMRFAHEIKKNPPKPGYMSTVVKPGIYSIDLNVDAHWWFNHVCTVFPLLLDQGIRTHMDLKESFKPEKRLPDFNYMWIVAVVVGIIAIFGTTKVFGFW
jgi:hypothetical protein